MYTKELDAIKKSNLLRVRNVYDETLIDMASNDYLGLAGNKTLFTNSYEKILKEQYHAPKASLLVNGYSKFHEKFEKNLCMFNGFEAGVVVGSGFLANISMIEALVRKGDILFIDEEYHASGILATKLLEKNQVVVFEHNNPEDLKQKMQQHKAKKRTLIAIEGIYSMGGDLAPKEIFTIADESNAILMVDEAHSSGVIGENLSGIFNHYGITPKSNHIKMGTLGKAYGSYGAYILASAHIIEFLLNRAKAIIYTTAPSLFDIVLGNESLNYIQNNRTKLKKKIKERQELIRNELNIDAQSLIIAYEIGDNKKVLEIQALLKQKGYLVGAIRQPTVKSAIIRLIAKTDVSMEHLQEVCQIIKSY
mgnify:CR=1 FL=1